MSKEKYQLKHIKMTKKYKLYALLVFIILMFFLGVFVGVKTIDTINIEGIINTIWLLLGLYISTIIILFYIEDE